MPEWLRPFKVLEHYVDPYFGTMEVAEQQLYSAVIRSDVRARHRGGVLGPEQLKQISEMKRRSAFELPADIELSTEDVERVLGETFGIDKAKGH
jgi:hypothetical protein